jgi:hypothetical protein
MLLLLEETRGVRFSKAGGGRVEEKLGMIRVFARDIAVSQRQAANSMIQ